MGQIQVYANLGNIWGFIQLTKVPTTVIILFGTPIPEPNAGHSITGSFLPKGILLIPWEEKSFGFEKPVWNRACKCALWCHPADPIAHWNWDEDHRAEHLRVYLIQPCWKLSRKGHFISLYSESLSHNLEKVKEEETMAGGEAKRYLENVWSL